MEMMEKATVFAEGKTFKDLGLRQELVEACYKLGWTTPTIIQAEAISHALEGRDLIGLAQTGSGKTGAFALPILQKFLDTTKRHPFFACIVAPTRELAAQICKDFEDLGSSVGVKCAVIMGGTSKMEQAIALAKRPDILVATPGRLLDHLTNTKGFCLRTLKYLVLDEADKLLNADFEKAIGEIVQAAPRERNTYLFSATMTEKVRRLKRACLRNPTKVEASSKYSTNDTLTQQFVFLPANQKDFYLVYILNKMAGRTSMVFTRTCESTRLLALTLRNLGLKAIPLNGHMSEANRLESLHKFQAGEYNILVCTDVGSRGLDMEVDLVINYDIPQNSKDKPGLLNLTAVAVDELVPYLGGDYCHRVGRTARAGRFGTAISLVNQYEVAWFSQIEERIKKKLTLFPTKEAKVLLLCDQVAEAKKIALKSIRDSKEKKRKKFEDEDEDGSDVQVKSRKTKKADKMRLKS